MMLDYEFVREALWQIGLIFSVGMITLPWLCMMCCTAVKRLIGWLRRDKERRKACMFVAVNIPGTSGYRLTGRGGQNVQN
jgi:hypothetical protein